MFDPCETAANVATAANELTDAVRRFAALATDAEPLARLTAAINRCCTARGDDERNRLALHAACRGLTEAHQADLAEHFEEEAARWEAATSGRTSVPPPAIPMRGRYEVEFARVCPQNFCHLSCHGRSP